MTKANTSSNDIVTGLFRDSENVERAYHIALRRGYHHGDINVVMSDETRRRSLTKGHELEPKLRHKIAEGGALGGPMGGTIGIAIPVLAALGTFFVFPVLGLAVSGPVVAALAGAGVAGATVGLMAIFSDWGLPEERAREYESGIDHGGILLGVKTHSHEDAEYLEREWRAHGGRLVHS